MTEQRLNVLRRFCLCAPMLSAASLALVVLTPLRSMILQAAQSVAPGLASFLGVAPVLGWLALTLGCSAFTAIDLLIGSEERPRTFLATLTIFFGHLLNIAVLVFACAGGFVLLHR